MMADKEWREKVTVQEEMPYAIVHGKIVEFTKEPTPPPSPPATPATVPAEPGSTG